MNGHSNGHRPARRPVIPRVESAAAAGEQLDDLEQRMRDGAAMRPSRCLDCGGLCLTTLLCRPCTQKRGGGWGTGSEASAENWDWFHGTAQDAAAAHPEGNWRAKRSNLDDNTKRLRSARTERDPEMRVEDLLLWGGGEE